jgi:hypothetical protein
MSDDEKKGYRRPSIEIVLGAGIPVALQPGYHRIDTLEDDIEDRPLRRAATPIYDLGSGAPPTMWPGPFIPAKTTVTLSGVVSGMADPEPTRNRLELFHDLHIFLNGLGTKFGECDCPMCSLRKDVAIYFRREQEVPQGEEVDPMEDTAVEMPAAKAAEAMRTLTEARSFYEAYCESSDWKNFKGDPCPVWAALPDDIVKNWCAVVRHARKG